MGIIEHIKNYISEQCIATGKALWGAFNNEAPAPVGILENDEDRIRLFKAWTKKCSKRRLKALQAFIKNQLDWWNDEPEIISTVVEENYRKWRQIFTQHMEIVKQELSAK